MEKCNACGKDVENYVEMINESKKNVEKGKGRVVLCLDCKRLSDKKKS